MIPSSRGGTQHEPGLTREARHIAANIVKVPELLRR
jgi:hypothetical protein